ncbi:hypothetical protein Bca4012_010449 [Brassica carinata]
MENLEYSFRENITSLVLSVALNQETKSRVDTCFFSVRTTCIWLQSQVLSVRFGNRVAFLFLIEVVQAFEDCFQQWEKDLKLRSLAYEEETMRNGRDPTQAPLIHFIPSLKVCIAQAY